MREFGARIVAGTGQVNCEQGLTCDTGLPSIGAGSVQLQQILQIVFGVLAVVAVLMIVLAGLKFITDGNNPQEVAKARNTIIYAAVGLVIAISGQLIVAFVLNRL